MASAFHVENRIIGQAGTAPFTVARPFSLTDGHVDPRQRVRRSCNRLARFDDLPRQFLEMGFLGSQRMRSGLRDPTGFLMQAHRIEAHGARHGLTVRKAAFGSHQGIAMPGGDFDEIAQHLVMPDLQRRDARVFAILALQCRNGAARISARLAQCVERVIVALRDVAPLGPLGRRNWHERARQRIDQSAMPAQRVGGLCHQRGHVGGLRDELLQLACAREPIPDLAQVARTSAACDHAAKCTRDVGQRT